MEEDTYKGESPAKKFARLQYWLKVSTILGPKRFHEGKHLVLASREGGDVSVLLGLGVPAKNIVPVDHNRQAAFAAQEKFPEVQVVCADVAQVARDNRRQFASMFLDFCAPVSEKLLDKVLEVMTFGLAADAAVGCAFLNGRERGEMTETLKKERERFNRAVVRLADLPNDQLLETYAPEEAMEWPYDKRQRFIENVRSELVEFMADGEAPLTRATYVDFELMTRGFDRKCSPYAVAYLSYISATEKSKGVPMFIYLGKLCRGLPGASSLKFKRAMTKKRWEHGSPIVMQVEVDDPGLRTLVLRGFDHLSDAQTKEWLEGAPWHLLLNVPKGKIAAWRAHRTMGTYDQ